MTRASGTFTFSSWDEAPYDETGGGAKLTRAAIVFVYAGDLEGEGRNTTLMTYPDDTSATYVGLERIAGTLAGRTGGFVVELTGAFGDGVARSSWRIVAGTGRDGLAGITGEGGGESAQGREPYTWWLDYELPAS
jgi:Protein of unknown function (DUF3224)